MHRTRMQDSGSKPRFQLSRPLNDCLADIDDFYSNASENPEASSWQYPSNEFQKVSLDTKPSAGLSWLGFGTKTAQDVSAPPAVKQDTGVAKTLLVPADPAAYIAALQLANKKLVEENKALVDGKTTFEQAVVQAQSGRVAREIADFKDASAVEWAKTRAEIEAQSDQAAREIAELKKASSAECARTRAEIETHALPHLVLTKKLADFMQAYDPEGKNDKQRGQDLRALLALATEAVELQ